MTIHRLNYPLAAAFLFLAVSTAAVAAPKYVLQLSRPGLVVTDASPAPKVAVGSLQADSSADFGALVSGASASRNFIFSNTGTAPALGVFAAVPATRGLTITANTCGTAAAPVSVEPGAACAITLTYGGSTPSRLNGSVLEIAGDFTGEPARLELAGTLGTFSAAGSWSSTGRGLVPPNATDLAFGGNKSLGGSYRKDYFLVNSGQGYPSVGFVLSGDTSQFKISSVNAVFDEFNSSKCATGTGVVSADRLSTTYCTTTSGKNLMLSLTYTPTELGTHSLTITPVTDNGTQLPQPLVIAASTVFNPKGTWSTRSDGIFAVTASTLAYGVTSLGTSSQKPLFLYNTGTNGGTAVGYVLSGDTEHFELSKPSLFAQYKSAACLTGGIVSADKTSVTPCLAMDVFSGAQPSVQFALTYVPKAVGDHQVTLTPVTDNGTILPNPLTFTGGARFNAAGAWSSVYDRVTALTVNDQTYKAAVGGSAVKSHYMHNIGQYGALAVGFKLTGDVEHFKLRHLMKFGTIYYGTSEACAKGGVVAADGLSATPCHANASNSTFPSIVFGTQFSPKAAGTFSVTLTPVTENGTVLPGAVTLTGTTTP